MDAYQVLAEAITGKQRVVARYHDESAAEDAAK